MTMSYLQVEIVGGVDLFIHHGSPAQIECRVSKFIVPPQTVHWSHNNLTIGRLSEMITTSHLTEWTPITLHIQLVLIFLKVSTR